MNKMHVFFIAWLCQVAPGLKKSLSHAPDQLMLCGKSHLNDLDEQYMIVVYSGHKLLITCNSPKGYLTADVDPDEKNEMFKNFFVSYKCLNGFWINEDKKFNDRNMVCKKMCLNPPIDDELHIYAEEKSCTFVTTMMMSTKLYTKCTVQCSKGYYAANEGQKQTETQDVYCKNKLQHSFWNVNKGTDLKMFVKCYEGCFAFGSNPYEDTYGMIVNSRNIGYIKDVARYRTGEIYCDRDNGFFPVSSEERIALTIACEAGVAWGPTELIYYCTKGCLKPGGKLGGKTIAGKRFACTNGHNGWYQSCSYSCNQDEGYVMTGIKDDKLPEKSMAEKVYCKKGDFDFESLKYTCAIRCSLTDPCKEGFVCSGRVYRHNAKDTGRRYCVDAKSPRGSKRFGFTKSMITQFFANTVGNYDFLY